ncbi:MAG TPA: HNH endonuclease [Armatimonadota bacterium]|nr:HNH endonuclease [Armatimonadota bacterium]HOP79134.1 HNH endonuclease [Armatimonadota bacterium]HPP75714.1 HNH endonuclease [Armatimonadota bacterium]
MDQAGDLNQEVLVLNSDYAPLNVCNLKRAISLVFRGKVDVLHYDHRLIRTLKGTVDAPSVVRLKQHIRRPMPELRLSRRSIFARDNYTCQYCGQKSKELTIDHVIPKRMGGPSTWENLVCCCRKCNTKKGDKTLQQVGFELKRQPRRPKYVPFIGMTKLAGNSRNGAWRDYLPIFDDPEPLEHEGEN